MGKQLLWDGQKYKKDKLINAPIKTIRQLIPWGILLLLIFLIPTMIFVSFIGFCILIGLWSNITGDSETKIKLRINDGYYDSIRQALLTPYPHGIVYILENTLKHLENFGIDDIDFLPCKNNFHEIEYGWPNKTVLREAIEIAKFTIKRWDNLEPAERTGTMATLRQLIKPEVMYLRGHIRLPMGIEEVFGKGLVYNGVWKGYVYNGPNIKLNHHHYYIDIYKYYYDEDDYRRDRGNNPKNHHVSNVNPEPQKSFPTTYPQPQSNPQPQPRILTFEEYLQQHPGLLYLSEPEQRDEYQKYLASMGVQPPSSATRPYSSDNSNHGTGNKEDDSVW